MPLNQPEVTPQAALKAQIDRYRAMTREERVGIALRLHEQNDGRWFGILAVGV
jgi:hypothetical protein